MGVMIGVGVHIKQAGDPCHLALTLVDNPPDYDNIDVAVITKGPLGTVVIGQLNNVVRDNAGTTEGTFHDPGNCPYA